MNIEIEKSMFLPVEGITSLESSKIKLEDINYSNNKINYTITLDVSYKDSLNHECFKILTYNDSLDLNSANIKIVKSNIFVVELSGLEVNYVLMVLDNIKEDNNEIIKEEIKADYEDKLITEMKERNTEIIETKSNKNEKDFLNFFDNSLSNYFKIKTIYMVEEKNLDSISKKYNISLEELLKGYDRQNKSVIFKLKG